MKKNGFFLDLVIKRLKTKILRRKKGMSILIIIDNIVGSKLIKAKTNYKYLTGYLDEVIGPLILILPKMSGYFKT